MYYMFCIFFSYLPLYLVCELSLRVTKPYFSKLNSSLGTLEGGKQNRMLIREGILVGWDTMVKEEMVMG